MPLNKSFQRRIEVLDACFRRRQRIWTIDTLLQEVNEKLEGMGSSKISRRSLYDDLKELTLAYDAPVEKYPNGKQTCYRYSNPVFSIRNLPLKQEEVGYLRDALDILHQVQGFQLTKELETVIAKLENTIATSVEKRHQIIQFEVETLATGSQWLDDLFNAIKGKTVLGLRYKPFNREDATDYEYHPYLLKEYRNRWFVIGRKEGRSSPTILALDRIMKLKPIQKSFEPNDLFDPETYFNNVVGVTLMKDAVTEQVRMQVKPDLAPYVLTKPIHSSQRLIKTSSKGVIILEITVVNNYELRSLLLGLGPRLKVLKPKELREQMKAMYEEGLAAY